MCFLPGHSISAQFSSLALGLTAFPLPHDSNQCLSMSGLCSSSPWLGYAIPLRVDVSSFPFSSHPLRSYALLGNSTAMPSLAVPFPLTSNLFSSISFHRLNAPFQRSSTHGLSVTKRRFAAHFLIMAALCNSSAGFVRAEPIRSCVDRVKAIPFHLRDRQFHGVSVHTYPLIAIP